MPQLNPNPWLFIMIFSWLVFSLATMPLTLKHIFPNELMTTDTKTPGTLPWTWQWF